MRSPLDVLLGLLLVCVCLQPASVLAVRACPLEHARGGAGEESNAACVDQRGRSQAAIFTGVAALSALVAVGIVALASQVLLHDVSSHQKNQLPPR